MCSSDLNSVVGSHALTGHCCALIPAAYHVTVMSSFDPTEFGFVLLRDFQFPGGVSVYERGNHPAIDGRPDFLRLNLYLSKDGGYVTIWHGLLDVIATEAVFQTGALAHIKMPSGSDFLLSYDEMLFRGHIDSVETATHILKALRVDQHHRHPQVLSADADNKLKCDVMGSVE